MKRGILRWLCLFLSSLSGMAAEKEGEMIRAAQRVLFLGDSITWDGRHLVDLELWLGGQRDFINLGLPSETVSGLSEKRHAGGRFARPVLRERLMRVLSRTGPDVIVACYGINCGIYRPFQQGHFQKFREGMIELRNAAARVGAELIVLTPWPYDAQVGPKRIPESYDDEVLARYRDWLLQQREFGWQVLDTHGALTQRLIEVRKHDAQAKFTRDGIHFNDRGAWEVARILIRELGGEDFESEEKFLAQIDISAVEREAAREAMRKKRDEWLAKTWHLRPGLPGGPERKKRQGGDEQTRGES